MTAIVFENFQRSAENPQEICNGEAFSREESVETLVLRAFPFSSA